MSRFLLIIPSQDLSFLQLLIHYCKSSCYNSVIRVIFLSTFLSVGAWLTCQGERSLPFTGPAPADSECALLTVIVVTVVLAPGTLDVDMFFLVTAFVPVNDVSWNNWKQIWTVYFITHCLKDCWIAGKQCRPCSGLSVQKYVWILRENTVYKCYIATHTTISPNTVPKYWDRQTWANSVDLDQMP